MATLTTASEALLADHPELRGLTYGRTGEPIFEAIEREAVERFPDVLDGARAEYQACLEVRRLLGYLWTATGRNTAVAVSDMFDHNDPIVEDVERLAVFPERNEAT